MVIHAVVVMSMMVSFVLFFFLWGVLDEILNLTESVSEGFPSYFCLLEPKHISYEIPGYPASGDGMLI